MKLKKLLSITLALLMLLGMTGMPASAEDATATALDQFLYEQDDTAKTVTLSTYSGTATDVVVPGTYDIDGETYAVIIDSETIFARNATIKSVTIQSGVTFKNNSMARLFFNCAKLATVDLSALSTTGVTDMSRLFAQCSVLNNIDISTFDTSLVTTMERIVYGCPMLTSISFEGLDTSKVTTFKNAFRNCSKLSSINFTGIDTTSVTDMSWMFGACKALETLDLSDLDTGSVTTIDSMFYDCTGLKTIVGHENFDTSSLKIMCYAFGHTNALQRLDMSGWDLSNVEDNSWCFTQTGLTELLLPDNLPAIHGGAMNHFRLLQGTSYTIPAGVEKIGYAHVFYDFGTNDFVEFKVAEGNTDYKAVDGVLYSADGTKYMSMPRGKTFVDGTYEILEGVTFIPELSFSRNTNLHTIVLPNSYEIRQYVPAHDPEYILIENEYGDDGNLNDGNSLSIACYWYTGVTDYAVKADNPNYASVDGIIYDKNMTEVIAIPTRYNKPIDIPEGVTTWNDDAIWNKSSVDTYLAYSGGVSIPSTLTNISQQQLAILNRIEAKNGQTATGYIAAFDETGGNIYADPAPVYNFSISVDEDNPYYSTDADGQLVEFGAALSPKSYAYDGTAKEPQVTVRSAGTILAEGTDYTLEYINNTNIGTASVIVTGIGTYAGKSVTKNFAIADGEAMIGDVVYATLAEAVTAANAMEGDVTITLLCDITFKQMYTITGNVTIDGAGHTLTRYDDETDNSLDYTGALFTVENGASLTLNDLTIDGNNNWVFNEDVYMADLSGKTMTSDRFSTYYTFEDGAPVANTSLIIANGAVTLNDAIIQNNAAQGANLILANSGSSVILNSATVDNCVSNSSVVINAQDAEVVINEGTLLTNNLGTQNGALMLIKNGSSLTMNGGEVKNNYGSNAGIIMVEDTGSTFTMNDGLFSENTNRAMVVYIAANASMDMYGGEFSDNLTQGWQVIDANQSGSKLTVYGGSVINNENYQFSGVYGVAQSGGKTVLYGGEYTCGDTYLNGLNRLCAPGYTTYPVDEDDDGVAEYYRVIRLMSIDFEEVEQPGVEGEKLYDIVVVTSEGDEINRLNTADLTFKLNVDEVNGVKGDINYEIIASNEEIEINNVAGDRYEFHYKDKDGVTTDTAYKIIIGQVKFTGYGQFDFHVDTSVDTNLVTATTLTNNIVTNFAPEGEEGLLYLGGVDGDEDEDRISNEVIEVAARNLGIEIAFPNIVNFNAADYQNMKVTVIGGLVNAEFALGAADTTDDEGNTVKGETGYTGKVKYGAEKSAYTVSTAPVTMQLESADGAGYDDVEVNGYRIDLKLPKNTNYTITVSGAGYRTARYNVVLTEDKEIKFWNNVMDAPRVMEILTKGIGVEDDPADDAADDVNVPESETTLNFLAGDIVEDSNINVYDLSAVVSYFNTAITDPADYATYVKYDLNRDGIIDSKDVAYVLVSWGN